MSKRVASRRVLLQVIRLKNAPLQSKKHNGFNTGTAKVSETKGTQKLHCYRKPETIEETKRNKNNRQLFFGPVHVRLMRTDDTTNCGASASLGSHKKHVKANRPIKLY